MTGNRLDEISRRNFLTRTARTCFGLSIAGSASQLFGSSSGEAGHGLQTGGGGKARHVIFLYMSGGMTHIDTFDPKPDAPAGYRGPTRAIDTNVAGIRLGHCLPKLAGQMDKVALIRSLSTTQGAHEQGNYLMHTGYARRGLVNHPSTGAWVSHLKPPLDKTLPSFITVGVGNNHPGSGFFEPRYGPVPVGDATKGLRNVRARNDTDDAAMERQLKLREELDRDFDNKFFGKRRSVRAYDEIYTSAVRLMKSKDLEAFDLSKESQANRTAYGQDNFGQGVLLARRLVEKGVRFVEVEYGGFDWHADNFEQMERKIPVLDQALSALLADLSAKGLLESTLVVVGTEFGRSPKIVTTTAGRDHYPKAFSCLMAGGGVTGGRTYGATDSTASVVIENGIGPADVNATIAHAMGIPHDLPLMSPSKRPFKMGGLDGSPIYGLFG